jgi:broad specificity phosphatase PhoE
MSNFPAVYLARHGETAWTITGQHTGRKDIPLTEGGRVQRTKAGRAATRHDFRESVHKPFAAG